MHCFQARWRHLSGAELQLSTAHSSQGMGWGFVLHIQLDLESSDDTSPVHLFNLSQCLATVTVKDSYYLLSF